MKLISPHSRRTGQALLLAVLLMVFAAVLAAAFVTVVAINLNTTARQSDKTRAQQAAQAGLDYVNRQLAFSDDGERWFQNFNLTMANSNPLYYSAVERAQGWAGQFAKFPDPNRPADDAPQFLARVEQIPYSLAAGTPDFDKAGALKITVIGEAADDAAVFHKIVAYKGGINAEPLAHVMRGVGNWDFRANTVPVAQVQSYDSTTRQITFAQPKGAFPLAPFAIMIGDPQSGNVRGAVVQSSTAGVLTLAVAPTVAPVAGERIELAASLGAPSPTPGVASALDFDNDSATAATPINLNLSRSAAPGSARINGSVWWQGSNLADGLRANQNAFGTSNSAPGTIKVSGLMALENAVSGVKLKSSAMTTGGDLAESNDANFPSNTGDWATLSNAQRDQLVSDGWNRLAGNNSILRQTKPFTPPDIAAGEGGLSRYRNLTKFSKATPAQAANFGYGKGIYIDNALDRERIHDAGRLRDMTQAELIQMWLSPTGATEGFTREGTAKLANALDASLEEKHLRGWIGPDEFRARGALVELDADNQKVIVTLDSRADGANAGLGAVAQKSWRDSNGALESDIVDGGVYRKVFNWPANGVIFAEGNLRIKGTGTGDPGRSLTVVSMNNIYIEDSLDAGTRKVLLLARKNVVVNPTAILSRVDAQTRLSIASDGTEEITVADANLFQPGDWISLDGTTVVARVLSVTSANDLTLDRVVPTGLAAKTIVRGITDARDPVTNLPVTKTNQLTQFADVLQRRFPNGAAGNVRFALRHSAERRPAFQIEFGGVGPLNPSLTVKKAANAQTQLIAGAEKTLVVNYLGGPDTFPSPLSGTLATLESQMDGSSAGAPLWTYNTSILNGLGVLANVPLYHFLAGVGNRANIGGAGSFPWSQNLLTDKEIPIATSVTATSDGTTGNKPILADQWGTGFQSSNQFGFATTQADPEDALTVDQSFYTPYPGAAAGAPIPDALDSRVVAAPASSGTFALRFNETAKNYFDPNPTASAHLPFYRLSRLKLENVTLDGSHNFQQLAPGHTLKIKAFVYAQEGSWFVIPGPFFDESVKNNTDINRDGTISQNQGEKVAAYRFHRDNYAIQFTGAIMENQTALVNNAGTARGAVADWTDKWASITANADASTLNLDVIAYSFDDSVARGQLAGDEGFRLPHNLDLIYQG